MGMEVSATYDRTLFVLHDIIHIRNNMISTSSMPWKIFLIAGPQGGGAFCDLDSLCDSQCTMSATHFYTCQTHSCNSNLFLQSRIQSSSREFWHPPTNNSVKFGLKFSPFSEHTIAYVRLRKALFKALIRTIFFTCSVSPELLLGFALFVIALR